MTTTPLWRPFDRRCIADPYPMYARLREEDPVHLAQPGEWVITRYEDARNILRSPDFLVGNRIEWLKKSISNSKYRDMDFSAITKAMEGFVLFLNPPGHTRIRKFIHQAWNSREVEMIIKNNLNLLLSQQSNSLDLINDLGKPLPVMSISKILGLPEKDYSYLNQLGSVMIKALDLYFSYKDIIKINEASEKFTIYFEKIIAEKELHPDDGIVSRLVQLNKQDNVLSENELISSCILLFIAGEETSLSLLGTGLLHLIQRPEILEELRKNPAKISTAIEELLRYDAPVQIVARMAGKDCEVGGKPIKQGESLTICLGSANRDAVAFENADEFIMDRNPNRHLGFGGGAHYCLGDWLARMQTELTIKALLERYQSIQLIDAEPTWNDNLAIRCLTKLPVKVR